MHLPKGGQGTKSELMFVLTQREKVGDKFEMCIGDEDIVASRRHASLNARKAKQEYEQRMATAMLCSA